MTRNDALLIGAILAGLILSAGGVATLAYWKRSANAARFIPALHTAEDANDIPRDLLARVAFQESHFRDDIISGKVRSAAGAAGLMQLIPKWHPDVDALDPYASIAYAGQYLGSLFRQFGSWKLALAAYNWGPTNVSINLNRPGMWPQETIDYIAQITKDVPVV